MSYDFFGDCRFESDTKSELCSSQIPKPKVNDGSIHPSGQTSFIKPLPLPQSEHFNQGPPGLSEATPKSTSTQPPQAQSPFMSFLRTPSSTLLSALGVTASPNVTAMSPSVRSRSSSMASPSPAFGSVDILQLNPNSSTHLTNSGHFVSTPASATNGNDDIFMTPSVFSASQGGVACNEQGSGQNKPSIPRAPPVSTHGTGPQNQRAAIQKLYSSSTPHTTSANMSTLDLEAAPMTYLSLNESYSGPCGQSTPQTPSNLDLNTQNLAKGLPSQNHMLKPPHPSLFGETL